MEGVKNHDFSMRFMCANAFVGKKLLKTFLEIINVFQLGKALQPTWSKGEVTIDVFMAVARGQKAKFTAPQGVEGYSGGHESEAGLVFDFLRAIIGLNV